MPMSEKRQKIQQFKNKRIFFYPNFENRNMERNLEKQAWKNVKKASSKCADWLFCCFRTPFFNRLKNFCCSTFAVGNLFFNSSFHIISQQTITFIKAPQLFVLYFVLFTVSFSSPTTMRPINQGKDQFSSKIASWKTVFHSLYSNLEADDSLRGHTSSFSPTVPLPELETKIKNYEI